MPAIDRNWPTTSNRGSSSRATLSLTHKRLHHLSPVVSCSLPRGAGALDEVDWLRTKLEALEAALLSGSLDSGLLAALDSGGIVPGATSAADVLEAARAAVAGAEGSSGAASTSLGMGLRQPMVVGPEAGPGPLAGGSPAGLSSMDPLASMLAAAAEFATSTEERAVAEAAAAAAALAVADDVHSLASPAGDAPTPMPAALTGPDAEQWQAEGDGASERAAARAPLIDPDLVANPSELEGEGPVATAISGTSHSAAVSAAHELAGPAEGEAARPDEQPLLAQPPLAGAPDATLAVGRPSSAKAAAPSAELADGQAQGILLPVVC